MAVEDMRAGSGLRPAPRASLFYDPFIRAIVIQALLAIALILVVVVVVLIAIVLLLVFLIVIVVI